MIYGQGVQCGQCKSYCSPVQSQCHNCKSTDIRLGPSRDEYRKSIGYTEGHGGK